MILLVIIPTIYVLSLMARAIQIYAPTNVLIRHLRAQPPRWRHVGLYVVLGAVLYIPMILIAPSTEQHEVSARVFLGMLLLYDGFKFWWHAFLMAVRCVVCATCRSARGLAGRLAPPGGT